MNTINLESLDARVSEIEESVAVIADYLLTRDRAERGDTELSDDPKVYLFQYITDVIRVEPFEGKMTDLFDESGFKRFYDAVPPMGRVFKAIKPNLEKCGFVITKLDRLGLFRVEYDRENTVK